MFYGFPYVVALCDRIEGSKPPACILSFSMDSRMLLQFLIE